PTSRPTPSTSATDLHHSPAPSLSHSHSCSCSYSCSLPLFDPDPDFDPDFDLALDLNLLDPSVQLLPLAGVPSPAHRGKQLIRKEILDELVVVRFGETVGRRYQNNDFLTALLSR
ncbi:MAG: hypothetical protein ACC661_05965, partial [Verrucomicrobiales bacterium]